ncbi:MAG: hypothetical protein HC861_05460 [Rhodospirillaceae bacterium]|nr:hypothetical protein [Rhodospirillaceae bacterium]
MKLTEAKIESDPNSPPLKETGSPELATVVRVLKALGLRLSAQPIAEEKPKRRTKAAKKAA